MKVLFKTLRLHQSLKNCLIFFPMMASFSFSISNIKNCFLAFLSFSLVASSLYILNDILDLKYDKKHPKKKYRPIASGKISITSSLFLASFTISLGFFMGFIINIKFFLIIIAYSILVLIYTTIIKKIFILDIIVLTSFYMIRIFAGESASEINLSHWLIMFSGFFFFSLASIKRITELILFQKNRTSKLKGRGYFQNDINFLISLTTSSIFASIIVFIFYINSTSTKIFYPNYEYLWPITIILFYWFSRIVSIACKGILHHDPVFFIINDKLSWFIFFLILFLTILAKNII